MPSATEACARLLNNRLDILCFRIGRRETRVFVELLKGILTVGEESTSVGAAWFAVVYGTADVEATGVGADLSSLRCFDLTIRISFAATAGKRCSFSFVAALAGVAFLVTLVRDEEDDKDTGRGFVKAKVRERGAAQVALVARTLGLEVSRGTARGRSARITTTDGAGRLFTI